MTESIYHVRKVSLGLKRRYRVSGDDGHGRPASPLCHAEKQLTASDRIDLFADDARREPVASVRESSGGLLAALTGYEVVSASGERLGSFGTLPARSVRRTTWQLDQPGAGHFVGTERSTRTALGRRLVGLVSGIAGQVVNSVARYHFDFEQDGAVGWSIEKPTLLDDWYRLIVHRDDLDRTLLFALVITMEARLRG